MKRRTFDFQIDNNGRILRDGNVRMDCESIHANEIIWERMRCSTGQMHWPTKDCAECMSCGLPLIILASR